MGDLDVQPRAAAARGFEGAVPDLLQRMFAPERAAQST
jgi:hypothetical protein